MGQKEIDNAYNPGAERIFLMSHPVHVGLIIPRVRDPKIAEIFRLFTEGDHLRLTDFAVAFPYAGVIVQEGEVEVKTKPETVVADFISRTFHKRGNETGRLDFMDLEGLEGIVLITSTTDAQLIKFQLDRGLKTEFSLLKDRITLIEVGEERGIELPETLPYRRMVIAKPRKIIQLVDDMAEASAV